MNNWQHEKTSYTETIRIIEPMEKKKRKEKYEPSLGTMLIFYFGIILIPFLLVLADTDESLVFSDYTLVIIAVFLIAILNEMIHIARYFSE